MFPGFSEMLSSGIMDGHNESLNIDPPLLSLMCSEVMSDEDCLDVNVEPMPFNKQLCFNHVNELGRRQYTSLKPGTVIIIESSPGIYYNAIIKDDVPSTFIDRGFGTHWVEVLADGEFVNPIRLVHLRGDRQCKYFIVYTNKPN